MSGQRQMAAFRPPPGLANRQVQTLLPRGLPRPHLDHRIEPLELPDGDFIELAWVEPAPVAVDAPLFVLFHGLEGSIDSPYARHLLNAASRLGWRALLMHFRGCGSLPNRLPRAYHSGDTADAYWLLGWLARRFPRAPRVAVGVSLGANMLVKLIAEDSANGLGLTGAMAIAPPLDLAGSADALEHGFARLYQRHLLTALKAKVAPRLAAGALPLSVTSQQLAGITRLREYDELITAPLHGFAGADDYYRRASAGPLLGEVDLPLLILHAEDDPFMPQRLYDGLALGPGVRLETSRHGGHVGFVEWRNGRLDSWLARRVASQLTAWRPSLWPARRRLSAPGG